MFFFYVMIRGPPSSTRTYPPFPSTPLFRALDEAAAQRPQPLHLGLELAQPVLDARVVDGARTVGSGAPAQLDEPAQAGVAEPLRQLEHRHPALGARSEEHTSELQSLMRISYAVFCLKKKKTHTRPYNT